MKYSTIFTPTARRFRVSVILFLALAISLASISIWLEVINVPSGFLVLSTAALTIYVIRFFSNRTLVGFFRSVCLIYLLGLLLCNLGETLSSFLGLPIQQTDLFNKQIYLVVEGYRGTANLVACAGISAYIVGMCLAELSFRKRDSILPMRKGLQLKQARFGRIALVIGLVFFSLFIFETIRLGRIAGVYSGIGTNSRLMITTMQLTLSSCIIYAAYVQESPGRSRVFWAISIAIYLFIAMLGWRGHSIAFIGAAFVVWMWYRKRIRKQVIIGTYLAIAILWAVVGDVRGGPLWQRDYVGSLNRFFDQPAHFLIYPFRIFSAQELSLRYALRFVEDYGIGYGKWYLNYVPYLIPNILGPARGVEVESSGSLAIIVSSLYVQAYGIGFTPIAEAYSNFGMVGTFVVLCFVGFFLQRLQLWVAKYPIPNRLVVLGTVGASVFWWLRNDSMQLGRYILWGLVLYWGMRRFFKTPVLVARTTLMGGRHYTAQQPKS